MEKFYLEKPTLKRKEEAIDYFNEHIKYNADMNDTGGINQFLKESTYENWLKELEKKTNLLELHFHNKGTVNVNCDVSNEPFDLPVEGSLFLVVKFGEEYNDDDEELLILPYNEHQMNVAQYIYELLVLSIPAKRVHPEVLNGTMHSEVLDKLAALAPQETHKETITIDPRWEGLKNLITDNK